jgi:diaminohydroxyphosphoribosylaminopyrimidine deaminase / 5-amino-6-(5-phosphoribosylamino)uracil reductase
VTDGEAMALALDLARSARAWSSPNPPVGAVIVRDAVVVGQGATQPVGGLHAEVMALREAGDLAQGATMAVTLEPHSFHGRTPPCTDAIIAAGIATVHVATLDPNPRVHGQGVAQLQAAGIVVTIGQGADEAEWLVAPFAHWLETSHPLGIAKFAMSLDGKIATRTGASQWITGPAARHATHGLRNASDAIVVGIGTALADDPLLTTRLPDLPPERMHHPLRVVADSAGRLPITARMLAPDMPGKMLIATTEKSSPEWRASMTNRGAEILALPATSDGRVDLVALWDALGKRGCLMAMVEGGGTLLGAAVAAGLIQRVAAFVAPIIIGGATASGPVGDPGVAALANALRLRWHQVTPVGDDLLLEGEIVPKE